MLRYKTETRPGLVALYDIGPGNGAGLFLQPRSPYGASSCKSMAYGLSWEDVRKNWQKLDPFLRIAPYPFFCGRLLPL